MSQSAPILAPLDLLKVRASFPILERKVKGRPLVYLDSAATAQKPQVVLDTLLDYYRNHNANIHRGIHSLAEEATAAYEATRDTVRDFLNAAHREEIVFTRGTTEGINVIAQTWGRTQLRPGDEVVITAMEHHSNIVPWQIVCEEKGAKLVVLPINDQGELRMEEAEKLIGPRTKIISAVHISNALGTVNPIESLIRRGRSVGAVILVDAAQSAVHLDLDVQALDCDFLVFSSHKVYGPTGVGVLYGKRRLLEEMPVYQGGGEMIREVTFERTTYNDLPYKYEAGTPNIADTIALKSALDFVAGVGKAAIQAHEEALLAYGTQCLEGIPGLKLIGTAAHKAGILSFVIEGLHPQDLGLLLDNQGIAVRTGHHCAEPVMRRFGISGTTRASLAMYNTQTEIDQLISGLHKAIHQLR